ncbi:DnaB-like helicase N-terminal domain-containing protein [Streptomyces sp. BA2]|uniref:DnaB-like helicase N-terminal domain-containing protein n=1 Tax=Streptomyces sp. BA2 TaxID=436595 RepID=UPI003014824B
MKPSLPSWGVVEVVVEQLAHQARPRLVADVEINRFKALWDEAHAAVSAAQTPGDSPTRESASGNSSSSSATRSSFLASPFVSRNGLIHQAIMDLHNAGKPVGVPQVATLLARRGQLEFCGGEDYLFECVKVAIKGAYKAGISVPDFAALSARKVRASSDAREELLASVFDPQSDAARVRRAFERVSKLHPDWKQSATGESPAS